MPNRSRANTRRKRLATQKLDKYRRHIATGEPGTTEPQRSQEVSFGMPANVGSGTQLGSAERIDTDAGEESRH